MREVRYCEVAHFHFIFLARDSYITLLFLTLQGTDVLYDLP